MNISTYPHHIIGLLLADGYTKIGVDEMSWDDMSKNNERWPAVCEVTEYRRKVYQIVLKLIQTHPALEGTNTVSFHDPIWAIFLSLEHERIHIETTSVYVSYFIFF